MALARRLQRFLDKHGIRYYEGKRAFVTSCLSPACGKEDHCYIWKNDGGAICFRCGRKWRWRWMVSAVAGCSADAAYEELFGFGAGNEIHRDLDPNLFEQKEGEIEGREPEITIGPDFIWAEHSDRAISYLTKRGIVGPYIPLIPLYDLRYHAAMDAVVFPIKKDTKAYGWQARRIEPKEGELRLISHVFAKSKFLLNQDHAEKCDRVVLVEGPFDCLHVDLRNEGYTGVASLGKGVSRDQMKLLLDMPAKEIFIGLDPDATDEVYEVVSRIGLGKKTYRVIPPPHRKDFGEATYEEVRKALSEALLMSSQTDVLEVHFK